MSTDTDERKCSHEELVDLTESLDDNEATFVVTTDEWEAVMSPSIETVGRDVETPYPFRYAGTPDSIDEIATALIDRFDESVRKFHTAIEQSGDTDEMSDEIGEPEYGDTAEDLWDEDRSSGPSTLTNSEARIALLHAESLLDAVAASVEDDTMDRWIDDVADSVFEIRAQTTPRGENEFFPAPNDEFVAYSDIDALGVDWSDGRPRMIPVSLDGDETVK